MNSFALAPISPTVANRLRQSGGEVVVADGHPGCPCRQCLRDAQVGDELVLVSYDPFRGQSPYRSASPIFVHRRDCGRPAIDEMPLQLTSRQLSVRAFDSDEMMIRAEVIDGTDLDGLLREMFAAPTTEVVHVHNASRGCWAAAVERRPAMVGTAG